MWQEAVAGQGRVRGTPGWFRLVAQALVPDRVLCRGQAVPERCGIPTAWRQGPLTGWR